MSTYIYPPPDPEQASSAEQLEWLLLTTPGAKIEISLCRYERARWLDPSEAWMADSSGPRIECMREAEAERVARMKRAGVDAR